MTAYLLVYASLALLTSAGVGATLAPHLGAQLTTPSCDASASVTPGSHHGAHHASVRADAACRTPDSDAKTASSAHREHDCSHDEDDVKDAESASRREETTSVGVDVRLA